MSDTTVPLSSQLSTGKLWLDIAVAGAVIFVVSRVLKYLDGLKVSRSSDRGAGCSHFGVEDAWGRTDLRWLAVGFRDPPYLVLIVDCAARRISPRHPLPVRPTQLPRRRATTDVVEPCTRSHLAQEVRL